MLSREEFYKRYDEIMPLICKDYWKMLRLAAAAVPHNANSICDLGIGTGNLSFAIRNTRPDIKIVGIDSNENFGDLAKKKLKSVSLIYGDLCSVDLPAMDCYVSSLTLHHLPYRKRNAQLSRIMEKTNHFINFDIFLTNGKNKKDTIMKVCEFAKHNFSDKGSLENIAEEMERNDYPANLEKEAEFYRERGYHFRSIHTKFPFAIYRVSR